jgi:hypothetical protein
MATLGVLLLGSCSDESGDHVVPPSFAQDDDRDDTGLASISGSVTIEASSPANARISVGDVVGSPDATGRFFLPGLAPADSVAWLRFNPQTSTVTCRPVQPSPGGEVHLPGVRLLKVDRYGAIFRNGAGGTVTVGGSWGSSATFADSSFLHQGQLFLSPCAPYVAVATADQAHFSAAFPGEFRGVRSDGTTVALEPAGVFWASVVGQGPAYLELAPGKFVTYRLAVDVGGGAPAPATILVWSLDMTSGVWHEVGEAGLVDNRYEVALASLAPVCWANPPATTCAVTGTVRDSGGLPLTGATVVYQALDGRTRQSALTDAQGAFAMTVTPSVAALVTPYFGSIVGAGQTIDTAATCPYYLADPLVVTLPDFQVDLAWTAGRGDLDAYLLVLVPDASAELALQWSINYRNPGDPDTAPFAWLAAENRDGTTPETIVGRRWYDGRVEYWVRDYTHRYTTDLRSSGARVDLAIGDQGWSFAVADTPFDEATADSTGWWHVFDIHIAGSEVAVAPVDSFAPAPPAR